MTDHEMEMLWHGIPGSRNDMRSIIAYGRAVEQAARATPAEQDKLMVWSGSMPESNGKTNFTAILHRGDISKGFTIERSEYPDRVRYEADRVRWLIGEIDKEPWVLDYDADKHSGYVAPADHSVPVAWEMDWPDYSYDGMGCGLEDRGITDRYEAMKYGWDEAMERVAFILNRDAPLYAQPPQNAADHIEAQSVPVAWQYRYRKTIGSVPPMSDWRECSEKDAKSYMADFEYGPDSLEVRALSVIAAVQAPQSDAQSVRDAAPAIPDGWRFRSADFSMNAKDSRYNGNVTLIRDLAGRLQWAALSGEGQEHIDLHVYGKGLTFGAALSDACEAALKSAPPQKPVSEK